MTRIRRSAMFLTNILAAWAAGCARLTRQTASNAKTGLGLIWRR